MEHDGKGMDDEAEIVIFRGSGDRSAPFRLAVRPDATHSIAQALEDLKVGEFEVRVAPRASTADYQSALRGEAAKQLLRRLLLATF